MIDFEGLGPEGGTITSIPGVAGVSFLNARLVIPEGAAGDIGETAFDGANLGGPGGLDQVFSGNTLTVKSPVVGTMSVLWASPVKQLAFDVADIDLTEVFTAKVFDSQVGGALLHTISFVGTAADDGTLRQVDFSSGFVGTDQIQRLEVSESVGPLSPVPGYAIDNISFQAVPEPCSFLAMSLLSCASCILRWLRRAEKSSVPGNRCA